MLLAVSALGGFLPGAAPQSAAAAAKDTGFKVLGKLSEPEGAQTEWLVGLDEKARRLYHLWRRGAEFHLREYDIKTAVPKLSREVLVGYSDQVRIDSASQYTLQIDRRHHRLLMLGQLQYGSVILVVDLKTFKLAGTWEIGKSLPGLVVQGFRVSERDNRIYLLGSQSGNPYGSTNAVVSKPNQLAVVAALDIPKDMDTPPAPVWVRPVPECQQVMDTYLIGAMLGQSEKTGALYFACVRLDPWPGSSGVVRLNIKPKATAQDAASFDVDFFPVSGSYVDATLGFGTLGLAAFDEHTDRFFMQSLAQATPGTWVLDGRLSSWVGFVAAPDSRNLYLGLDPSSGRFYMGSSRVGDHDGYVLVTDGRASPIPQGNVLYGLNAGSFIVTDPKTHRLFVRADLGELGLGKKGELGFAVLKDETPPIRPERAPDYDELTHDIPEGPGTSVSYSGGVNGFGARVHLVGGYGGILSLLTSTPISVGGVRTGDRGLTAARIPRLDLRDVGASATADPFAPDTNTQAELSDGGVTWPWSPASCLDGSGEAGGQSTEGPAGRAEVTCDLEKQTVNAGVDGGKIAAGDITIGSSSIRAQSRRDPKIGVTTEVLAVARGIELHSPQGTVSIGGVTARATTAAHGRPKTAKAEWIRSISGVEITDAEGKVQRFGECSNAAEDESCGPVIAAINEALQTRMRITLPKPQVIHTPHGAFAGVQQSDADFLQGRTMNNQGATFTNEGGSRAVPALQIEVFNDSVEKSRLLVQLAAIQSSSIYTIAPEAKYDSAPPPAPRTTVETPDAPAPAAPAPAPAQDPIEPAADFVDAAPAALDTSNSPVAAAVEAVQGVLAVLTRSPANALLFMSFWGLFGAAGYNVVRRRSLMKIIGGGS